MPSYQEHLEQARLNQEFCRSVVDLDGYRFRQWTVTAAFYAALHVVDAYLDRKIKQHPGAHSARDNLVRTHIAGVWKEYRSLKDDSGDARYGCITIAGSTIRQRVFPNLDKLDFIVKTPTLL